MSIRQPIGVAGIITPWNFPMAIPCWKMMPALVTGNTVVFKPASDTPHCATLLVELMAEAGLPAGRRQPRHRRRRRGRRRDRRVTRTSASSRSPARRRPGKSIADRPPGSGSSGCRSSSAARTASSSWPTPTSTSPTDGILWSRVRDDRPALHGLLARHRRRGRSSSPLLERLETRAKALRLGSGLDEATDVGPLINAGAVDKVASYIDIGRGGRASSCWAAAGPRTATWPTAHFFEPTIFSGVRPMDRIGQEEIFGPVLSVIPVDDYGEAMLALNQTRYGLSSSIYTRDVNTAFRAMRDFETGIVYVNAGTTGAETHLPFGGWKETGNGHREAGHVALDTYTEWKSIYVDFSGRLQRAQIDNQ